MTCHAKVTFRNVHSSSILHVFCVYLSEKVYTVILWHHFAHYQQPHKYICNMYSLFPYSVLNLNFKFCQVYNACTLLHIFDIDKTLCWFVGKCNLISKCPFGVFNSPKKPTKATKGQKRAEKDFCPYPLKVKRDQTKQIRSIYTTNCQLHDFILTLLDYFFDMTSF